MKRPATVRPKLTEALALEKISPTYQNLVAVRASDRNQPWVGDIADAYRSPVFLAVTIQRCAGFLKPDYQQALERGQQAGERSPQAAK